jgi:hypothetical protein
MTDKIKPIAFYLPQFHPIPENDEWWGKGFTEWTNVTKAKPLFEGHWQPRLPADLGFYDLRVEETRIQQAEMAKDYGVYGFCYWHYWFGGKRILERPMQEIVASGQPDFPFCLAWANQTWQGTWHGLSNKKILIEQTYPGEADHAAHFYALLDAFKDPRYIEVNGKKVFMIFQPLDIPDTEKFIAQWQQLATENGIGGFHFVALHTPTDFDHEALGYAAAVQAMNPWVVYVKEDKKKRNLFQKILYRWWVPKRELVKYPRKVSYEKYVKNYPQAQLASQQYPLICCDWDNTPRSGSDGWLFYDFSFELFEEHCKKAFQQTENKLGEEKIVIIKSWNEWAEGNYMEPDQRNGFAFLRTFQRALQQFNKTKQSIVGSI